MEYESDGDNKAAKALGGKDKADKANEKSESKP